MTLFSWLLAEVAYLMARVFTAMAVSLLGGPLEDADSPQSAGATVVYR